MSGRPSASCSRSANYKCYERLSSKKENDNGKEIQDRVHCYGRKREVEDASGLAPKFIPYYNSGERVKVGFVGVDGTVYEEVTGVVAATSEWRPSFMLKRQSRSVGSSWLLSEKDVLIAVKHGRTLCAAKRRSNTC